MAKQSKKGTQEFFTYKNKPLVRCGDVLYYGDITQEYIAKLEIKTKKEHMDTEIPDLVSVQLLLTDSNLKSRKQITKSSEKNGLYLALDVADAWLNRYLNKEE